MPALPAVANVNKCVLSGTIGTYNWAVVLHSQWTGTAPSVAAQTAFAGDIEAQWASHMLGLMQSNIILTEVQFTDLTSSTGNQGVWTGSEAGTASGTEAPGNAAVLINYPSSFRYRGGHPRTYSPPMNAGSLLDPAHWTSSQLAAFTTAWGDLVGPLYSATSGGCSLTGQCAVSYVSKAINPTPPYRRTTPVVMPIAQNSFLVNSRVASQRRRIGRK